MLRELNISGLAIIDQTDIEFGSGLNIITGETGAGKSIIIKAMNLLLGAKSDPTVIRSDRDHASISAEFLISRDSETFEKALEIGVVNDDGDSEFFLIRRTLFRNGRSKAWINDVPVTLNSLKVVTSDLLDLFSQHESHEMLNPKSHLNYLDAFLNSEVTLRAFESEYIKVQNSLKTLRERAACLTRLRQEQDYISFRFKELENLSPTEEDFLSIDKKIGNLENKQNHLELLAEASQIVDEGANIQEALSRLQAIADKLNARNDKFSAFNELAENTLESFNELSFMASSLASSVEEGNEDELEGLQERLSLYKELMRKTGAETAYDLEQKFNELGEQLESITRLEEELGALMSQIATQVEYLDQCAKALSKERCQAAIKVAKSLEGELKSLVMPNAKVSIDFLDVHSMMPGIETQGLTPEQQQTLGEISETLMGLNSRGRESAQFLLSANPGEALRPLQKVVSGGELSRIMLALKKALSAGANTCVLVFDEIDTGISGQIADVVGKKLKTLAENFQIICISHLPQVAVYGEQHFLVSKTQTKKKTATHFEMLGKKEREKEIARLLSGPDITKSSLQNAKTLMKRALEA